MTVLGEVLRLLSLAALGVFAGAMLTEGGVLVPYWQSLPAADFFAWYRANDARLLGFFGPLTSAAALLALASALVCLWQRHPGRWPAALAAALMAFAVATFFLYFQAANASFSAASLAPQDLSAELRRWATWHWLRTGVAFAALAAAALAARGR